MIVVVILKAIMKILDPRVCNEHVDQGRLVFKRLPRGFSVLLLWLCLASYSWPCSSLMHTRVVERCFYSYARVCCATCALVLKCFARNPDVTRLYGQSAADTWNVDMMEEGEEEMSTKRRGSLSVKRPGYAASGLLEWEGITANCVLADDFHYAHCLCNAFVCNLSSCEGEPAPKRRNSASNSATGDDNSEEGSGMPIVVPGRELLLFWLGIECHGWLGDCHGMGS